MTLAEAIAELQESLAAIEACTEAADYILCYPTGLAIAFTADHKPYVCRIDKAEAVGHLGMPEEAWAYTPIVKNGAGEQAQVIQRGAAAKREVAHLQAVIADLQQREA